MKVLILSVTAGDGHNSIGKALQEQLASLGCEVKFIDIFKNYSTKTLFKLIDNGSHFISQYLVGLYNFVYKKLNKLNQNKQNKTKPLKILKNLTQNLYSDILSFQPNAVICTHVYSAIAMSNLHQTYNLNCKTFAIVTDYGIHPYWECATKNNYLLLPTSNLITLALFKGYNSFQLKVFGLPIQKKFLTEIKKEQAKKMLNLKQNLFTVLFVLGKAKFKNITTTILQVSQIKNIQVIVVNGKNNKSKNKLKKIINKTKIKNILNLGYVNNLEILMSASDLIISKAGSSVVNESLQKEVPLIVYCSLPQQEKDNLNYLLQNNATIKVNSQSELIKVITKLKTNPQLIKKLITNIKKIKLPNASLDIANFIINTCQK